MKKYSLIGPSDSGQIEDLLIDLDDKESRQRLQALIAEWLRMENLVVLTAAGCSVECGGKIMSDLEKTVLCAVNEIPHAIDDTHATLSEGGKAIIAERLKDNDDEIEKLFSGEPKSEWAKTGFEEWLSYLVNAVHLGTEPKSPIASLIWKNGDVDLETVDRLLGYTAKAIYAECALELPDRTTSDKGEQDIAPHLSFLSKLVTRDSNLGRTHLFTLNYDTLFEQALELLGIQYFDGFTGRANARFDPSVYGLDVYYPGEIAEGRVRRFDKFLHFYKLHGSIHWRIVNDEIIARREDISGYATYRSMSEQDKAAELVKAEFAHSHKEFGILPTSNKFIQTLDMPYAHLFRLFNVRLSAPQTFLLVLGYGFGDDHVTRIIETALMNPALIMLVVEPNPESPTIKRIREYKELGKRAFVLTPTKEAFEAEPFKYATFDDFAKSVMPDVQWLDDFLRLRRFEKQLQKNSASIEQAEGK
ncbi:MAG: SIR2 family protein [Nitrosomonas sp.]|nr:SIR2 family protein [Nitrosomonas sp.]